MQGDVVRRHGDLGILEDGLRLGGEHEPVGVLVVEERLLPQPVPGERTACASSRSQIAKANIPRSWARHSGPWRA